MSPLFSQPSRVGSSGRSAHARFSCVMVCGDGITSTVSLLEAEVHTVSFDGTLAAECVLHIYAATSTVAAIISDDSLRSSASGSMRQVLVRQLCGQLQQISTSSANQSPSSSPIRRHVAQIPLVPTRIVLTTYGDNSSPIISRQAENSKNSTETTQSNMSCIEDYHYHLVTDSHIFTQLFGLAY
ncbi:hypothetical protein Aperf_G00000120257 [Anoplocephala perfoliata]